MAQSTPSGLIRRRSLILDTMSTQREPLRSLRGDLDNQVLNTPNLSSKLGRVALNSPVPMNSPGSVESQSDTPVMGSLDSHSNMKERPNYSFSITKNSSYASSYDTTSRVSSLCSSSCEEENAVPQSTCSVDVPAHFEKMTEDQVNCVSCPSNLGAMPSLRMGFAARLPNAGLTILQTEQRTGDYERRESLEMLSPEETCDGFELLNSGLQRTESAFVYRPRNVKALVLSRSSSGPQAVYNMAMPSEPERKKSRAHSPVRVNAPPDSFAQLPAPASPKREAPLPIQNRSVSMSEHARNTEGVWQSATMRRCVSQVHPAASEDLQEKAKKLECFADRNLNECISAETAAELLRGDPHMRALYDRVVFIDCRFQYEYNGGHIDVAPHLSDWVEVHHIPPHQSQEAMEFLFKGSGNRRLPMRVDQDRVCVIFHCEFSQKRGPDMCKKVRAEDRRLILNNGESYPNLYYPEMYVLSNGYKKFWESFPDMCLPPHYVAENDQRFADECRTFNKLADKSNSRKKMGRPARCSSLQISSPPSMSEQAAATPPAMDPMCQGFGRLLP